MEPPMHDISRGFRVKYPKLFERQWHLHGRSPSGQVDPRASLGCEAAWAASGPGSQEVVIALADDGCHTSHPALGGQKKFAGGAYKTHNAWTFQTHFNQFQNEVWAKGLTHGTSIAALISATGECGTIGVAPGCRLLPIRLPMRNNSVHIENDDLLAILDIINAHADIALLSFSRLPLLIPSSQVLSRWKCISQTGGRRGRGVLFIIPAGNSNCPISFEASQPIPYGLPPGEDQGRPRAATSRTFRNLLTEIPNVLHISAISSLARRSFYSCYGPGIDLCAPSSNSRVFTGELVPGHGLGLTTSYGPNGEVTDNFKGTSGSAALVAGVAALALSANPNASANKLAMSLTETASKDLDFRDTSQDIVRPCDWELPPVHPFDKGHFDDTSWSPWFGHGKVDAIAAVRYASSHCY